jgi:anti-sigma B factor antagonist
MENSVQRTRTDDGTIVVTVRGEIDFANADELADGVRDAVTDSTGVVRVDLRKATFIDSTGLGALIEGYRAATVSDVRFVVTNPTSSFRRVLTVTGLCDLFGLTEPAEEQAEQTQATGA